MNMPAQGCTLIWNNWAVPYERRNGVPYRLNLTFDQWGKLTAIHLTFSRRENDITRAQCLEIHRRTLDWLTEAYGPLKGLGTENLSDPEFMVTRSSSHGPDDDRMADVFLVSHFLRGGCDVNVSFTEAPAIKL
ncbi:MAG: hypothetical protein APF78_03845 [Sphingomonadales bacterium BRH_c3]|nr:MAG: hypothetical protein APF78_03845 [Sphingomonadales bacterium BRH_c3]